MQTTTNTLQPLFPSCYISTSLPLPPYNSFFSAYNPNPPAKRPSPLPFTTLPSFTLLQQKDSSFLPRTFFLGTLNGTPIFFWTDKFTPFFSAHGRLCGNEVPHDTFIQYARDIMAIS